MAIALSGMPACQWPPPNSWGVPQGSNNSGTVAGGDRDRQPTVTIVSDKERSDIVQVINFVPQNPWLIFDPMDGRVDGFKTTIYLAASVEGRPSGVKGFFGDGTIIVQMFRDAAEPGARAEMKIAHTWELNSQDAYPWRARKMALLGWGYGLRLRWPEGIDVAGRKVAFLVSYRRTDGRLISASKPIVKRVPLRGV